MNTGPPTEPVFTTRFAHELQVVTEALDANAIPYTTVAHNPWSQRWSGDLASQVAPSDVRWTILVPSDFSEQGRKAVASLPVTDDRGVARSLSSRDVHRGTVVLVVAVIALLLATVAHFIATARP